MTIEVGDKFIVPGLPKALYFKYITLIKGGEVMGHVNASFDFKEVPTEHYQLCLQLLRAHTLYLPMERPTVVPRPLAPPPKPWWKFWK